MRSALTDPLLLALGSGGSFSPVNSANAIFYAYHRTVFGSIVHNSPERKRSETPQSFSPLRIRSRLLTATRLRRLCEAGVVCSRTEVCRCEESIYKSYKSEL